MAEGKTLIHILPSVRWGGVERYAFDICRHFKNEGWNVMAMTRDAVAVDSLFRSEGISLIHAPMFGMFDLKTVRILASAIKQCKDNEVIVHVHGFRVACMALLAKKVSRRRDVRIVMTRHKVRRGANSWLFNKIYRNLDSIIFESEMSKKRFLSTWNNRRLPFREDKLHVIPDSLNIEHRQRKTKEKKGPTFAICHGILRPGKGIETLIDALCLLRGKRIRLRIVSSGKSDYVDKLRRRALSRGVMDMIDWHKQVSNPMELIENSDFGVLPSQNEEAFGIANLEVMAAGRPQIASANGAQKEYITDGKEGLLVTPGEPALLAKAMTRLAEDAELCENMGKRAYDRFYSFLSWQKFISRLTAVYTL